MKRFREDYGAQSWLNLCIQGIGYLLLAPSYADVPFTVGAQLTLDLLCGLCLLLSISAMRRGDTLHFWLGLLLCILPLLYVYHSVRYKLPMLIEMLS